MTLQGSLPAFAALVLLLLVSGIAPAQDKVDMKSLKVKSVKEWEGEYFPNTKSWTFEKYIDVQGEDTRKPNRIYVQVLPEDAPTKMKDYAEKLKTKDFQDYGFVYAEIAEQTEIEGGFLIKGLVKDTTDKDAKPSLGFVVVKKVGSAMLLAKSGVLVNEEMRKEGIDLAKSVSF